MKIFYTIIGIVWMCIIVGAYTILNKTFTEVKPGDVWQWTGDTDNPFEPPLILVDSVIAVRGGYVQYYRFKWEEVRSDDKSWFLVNKQLLRRPKCDK